MPLDDNDKSLLQPAASELKQCSLLVSQSHPVDEAPAKVFEAEAAARLLANSLTTEELRTWAGEQVVGPCARLLKSVPFRADSSSLELRTQLLRLIGNIVHTNDANRAKVLEHELASTLVSGLSDLAKQSHEPTGAYQEVKDTAPTRELVLLAVRANVGALLNLATDCAPAQETLASAGALIALSDVVAQCWKVFQSRTSLAEGEDLPEILCLSWSLRVIETLVADEQIAKAFPPSGVASLADIVLGSQVSGRLTDPPAGLMLSELEVLSTGSELLDRLSSESEAVQGALTTQERNSDSLLLSLLDFLHDRRDPPAQWAANAESLDDDPTTSWTTVRTNVGRTCMVGGSSDEAVDKLWPAGSRSAYVERLVAWFEGQDLVRSQPDLVIVAAILLGNVCRDDSRARSLVVDYAVLPALAYSLRQWLEETPRKSRAGERAQVLHALCSLLRNLSIPAENKIALGERGIVELASQCLDSRFDVAAPLQAVVMVLLKHLCGDSGNCARLAKAAEDASGSPLMRVVDSISRSDDAAIQTEGCRVVASVVRGLHRLASGQEPSSDDALPLKPVVPHLLQLLLLGKQRGPLLLNEALVALVLLASNGAGAQVICSHLDKEGKMVVAGATSTEDSSTQASATAVSIIHDLIAPISASNSLHNVPTEVAQNANTLVQTLDTVLSGESIPGDQKETWTRVKQSLQ